MKKPQVYTAAESSHADRLEACIPPRLEKAAIVIIGEVIGEDLHIHVHGRGSKEVSRELTGQVAVYLQAWLEKEMH